ncbi:Bcr/CflA family efflux transporter [Vibrio crassostreae]|uniref:multidrug effflux MFS transporter n=1 Tax=Vibrio crassostreae TaxID=246167 RepID=UPI001B30B2A8|nr:multidrug effflux MFS transporter [Vibrio crassostreae]CAK1834786.1 Bcr/CflA family efflux transporter [Vibrio crassostreae]CAK1968156.1 Bcr/CflA family efflux transporter [Vibrio crassostreae]CAK1974563.1 Bcr/CflA family efflux transporter [Vibrio crassostreae]CAK1976172.1 Bcr/CflA family efflux transporter [Vibrio crassostreae]CAK1997242.1 Bcr/CflA family efflux transporter [Vibrio crassostreae]
MSQSTFKKTPLLLAMMIIATGQVGVSIYLPSLPLIASDLSVTQVDVQLLVTLFLVGFGLSQLFYGPMSDAVGRRPIFLLGQGVYLIGTVVCVVFSDNMTALEVGRLLQGLGAGSASVLGRSVLRDSYDGSQLTKALSYISITASIMPIIAPVFGGWISFHLGWQAVFLFVLMYLLVIFTLGYFVLHETLPYGKSRFDACQVVKNYGRLLTNRQVLTSASYNWMSYMASLVSLSLFPFLMQEQLGLTAAEYGSLMIVPSAGLLIGSVALNLLNRRFSTPQLMSLAILIILASGAWLLTHELSIFNLVWAFTWLAIAQGISFPLSISMLLEPHKKQAGAVSALSGSIQMCMAGLLGGYLVESWVTTHLQLGVFYLIIGAGMGSVLWSTSRANKKIASAAIEYS